MNHNLLAKHYKFDTKLILYRIKEMFMTNTIDIEHIKYQIFIILMFNYKKINGYRNFNLKNIIFQNISLSQRLNTIGKNENGKYIIEYFKILNSEINEIIKELNNVLNKFLDIYKETTISQQEIISFEKIFKIMDFIDEKDNDINSLYNSWINRNYTAIKNILKK